MICLIAEMVFFVPGKIHDVLLKIIVEEDGFQETDPIFIGFNQGSLKYQFWGDQTIQRYSNFEGFRRYWCIVWVGVI